MNIFNRLALDLADETIMMMLRMIAMPMAGTAARLA
jgi:hypothetical protein